MDHAPDVAPLLDEVSLDAHVTELVERGAFVVASCSCGWRSYARRSRPLARAEGDEHRLLHQS